MMQFPQTSYYEMSDNEFDALIQGHFRKKYNVVAWEEWHNDSQHASGNITIEGYDEDMKENVIHFMEGTKPYEYWRIDWTELLHHLVYLGVIPEGNYLIEVCW